MNPTVEDQINLEQFYKTQAEEMFKKRMEDHRQKGNITSLAIGGGLKKVFVNTFSTNVKAWIEKETHSSTITPDNTRQVFIPASSPPIISVSILSPIIIVSSE